MYQFLDLHNVYHRLPLEPPSNICISHFDKFGFNPEKSQKIWKLLTIVFIEMVSFKKKVVSLALVCITRVKVAMISPAMSGFIFIRGNKISNAKINKNAEIGSP